MALKQCDDNDYWKLSITEEYAKAQLEERVKTDNCFFFYVNNEPENYYNIPLSNNDWTIIMDSVKNPEYNNKLADALKRPLLFEE